MFARRRDELGTGRHTSGMYGSRHEGNGVEWNELARNGMMRGWTCGKGDKRVPLQARAIPAAAGGNDTHMRPDTSDAGQRMGQIGSSRVEWSPSSVTATYTGRAMLVVEVALVHSVSSGVHVWRSTVAAYHSTCYDAHQEESAWTLVSRSMSHACMPIVVSPGQRDEETSGRRAPFRVQTHVRQQARSAHLVSWPVLPSCASKLVLVSWSWSVAVCVCACGGWREVTSREARVGIG